MESYAQITEMEAVLDAQTEQLARLNTLLDEMDQDAARYQALVDYYYSDQREQNLAEDEAGTLPQDLKRGVLSEDGIWNLMESRYDTALRMMETALAILKAR